MNIGLFSDTYLPDVNGVVTSVELLRKKLEEKGHEVYVICTYPGLLKVKKEGNIIRLPGLEIKKLYGYAVTQPVHLLLYDDIEALNLDLIHIHTEFGVGIFGQICADKFNIPVVRTYHTTYEDYTHYINFLDLDIIEKYGKKAVANISRYIANKAVRMISPSKKTKKLLLKYGVKTDISIIPTGTTLSHFDRANTSLEEIKEIRKEVGLKDGYKMILYVGRIAEEKSLEMLIEAFKILKEKAAPLKLVVIGGGPQLEELMDITSKAKLEDYIYFGNKRPFSLIPHYYHSADAFVSASTSETQGMTYVEAMASELPVFARRDESIEELLIEAENGYYFDNAEELVNKLLIFNELDESKRKEMALKGKEISKDYDDEIFIERILKVYNEAIEEYHNYHLVDDVKVKTDYINLLIKKSDNSEDNLVVTIDDFYHFGLRKGHLISENEYQELKEKEALILAYRGAIRRLAIRDYSTYEMVEYLRRNHNIGEENIDKIIKRLNEKQLLDDYKYAVNKVSMFKARFLSRKRIIASLKKVKIDDEIIDKVLNYDEDEEYQAAYRKGHYYQLSIKNKSLNQKKQNIIRKLVNEGFDYDLANRVVEELDFTAEIFKENDLLAKEASKQRKHYERKYSGSDLRNRVFNSLAAKGFAYKDIYAVMNEMEWENE